MTERCPTCEHKLEGFSDYPGVRIDDVHILTSTEQLEPHLKPLFYPQRLRYEKAIKSRPVREYLEWLQLHRGGTLAKPSKLNPGFEENPLFQGCFRVPDDSDLDIRIVNQGENQASVHLGKVTEYGCFDSGIPLARIVFKGFLNPPTPIKEEKIKRG